MITYHLAVLEIMSTFHPLVKVAPMIGKMIATQLVNFTNNRLSFTNNRLLLWLRLLLLWFDLPGPTKFHWEQPLPGRQVSALELLLRHDRLHHTQRQRCARTLRPLLRRMGSGQLDLEVFSLGDFTWEAQGSGDF